MITDLEIREKGYRVSDTRFRRPRMAILAVSEELKEEEVLTHIKRNLRNTKEVTDEDSEVKIVTQKNNRYEGKTVIIEVTRKTRNYLLKMEKIQIGWNQCKIVDSNTPRQCRKCFVYGHATSVCQDEVHRAHCGKKGHTVIKCKSHNRRPKCANCGEDHDSQNKQCIGYQTALKALQKTIKYD